MDYIRNTVASLAYQLLQLPMNPLKRRLAKQLLPYCAAEIAPGEYVLLNREHKPIGWPTKLPAFLNYDSPEYASWRFVESRAVVDSCTSASVTANGSFHYLYGKDRAAPWESYKDALDYRRRLCVLLGIGDIAEEGAL